MLMSRPYRASREFMGGSSLEHQEAAHSGQQSVGFFDLKSTQRAFPAKQRKACQKQTRCSAFGIPATSQACCKLDLYQIG